VVSLSLTTAVAAMSWLLVEKPALSLRTYLTRRPNPHEAQSTVALPIRDASLLPTLPGRAQARSLFGFPLPCN
jgi:peptidoglycan/LPS O-acetylase OafA/YrhL